MFAPGPGWALLKAISRAALQVSGAGPIIDVFADLMDFGKEVHQECRKDGIDQQMRQVLEDLAQMRFTLESEREALRTLVAEVAVGRDERDQVDLVMMLSAVPARVRQSLKRPEDRSGLTVSVSQLQRMQELEGIARLLPSRAPLFHPGDRLPANPDWKLIELLGVGGFGEVWKIKNEHTDAIRAAKFCTDPKAARMLKREARVVSRAQQARDPGIVRLEDTYFMAEISCLAYEYVDGIELGAWFQGSLDAGKSLNAIQMTRLILRLVEIIATVHALPEPIVHGDLKPANILMEFDVNQKQFRPRITDFGIGGVVGQLEVINATMVSRKNSAAKLTEGFRGAYSPLYASPEQSSGAERDPKDDVHALGMIWYQLVVGDLALERPGGRRWLKDLESRGLSGALVDLVSDCLEEVEERIPNAVVLYAQMKTALDHPDSPPPPWRVLREGSIAGEEYTNKLGMRMCWCPQGAFRMGSPENEPARSWYEDQVEVALTRGFWMGKYEVTQAEYEAILGNNPSYFHEGARGADRVVGLDTRRFPVDSVSWADALQFCDRLTARERQAGRLSDDWRYTLPTEAQWEYACRAGTESACYFGDRIDELPNHAWFNDNSGLGSWNALAYWASLEGQKDQPELYAIELRKHGCRPHQVGGKPRNPWGLHDMLGNVWEWCRDGFQSQLPGGRDPVAEPAENQHRVLRGGSWREFSRHCRSARRWSNQPSTRINSVGFRVAAVRST